MAGVSGSAQATPIIDIVAPTSGSAVTAWCFGWAPAMFVPLVFFLLRFSCSVLGWKVEEIMVRVTWRRAETGEREGAEGRWSQ